MQKQQGNDKNMLENTQVGMQNEILYTESNRMPRPVKLQAILSKAEIRLFCYFLLEKKRFSFSVEKEIKLREILNQKTDRKIEFGYLSKKGRSVLVIKEESAGVYGVYLGLNEDSSFNHRIQKLIANIKS